VNCETFDALPRQYTSNGNIALPILQYRVAGKRWYVFQMFWVRTVGGWMSPAWVCASALLGVYSTWRLFETNKMLTGLETYL
jgi:hypothetical protein